jgi:sorting nexin-8
MKTDPSNHPVIREDGLLAVFLTEPNLEAWRKHSSISLEEESSSKRIDRVQEMGIPSDLEERTAYGLDFARHCLACSSYLWADREVRRRINPLIEQWTRLCIVAERILKRRESTAVGYCLCRSVFISDGTLQSDISRLTTTMNALAEENPESWRADGDEFYHGVRQGLMTTSRRFRLHADLLERRVCTSA